MPESSCSAKSTLSPAFLAPSRRVASTSSPATPAAASFFPPPRAKSTAAHPFCPPAAEPEALSVVSGPPDPAQRPAAQSAVCGARRQHLSHAAAALKELRLSASLLSESVPSSVNAAEISGA